MPDRQAEIPAMRIRTYLVALIVSIFVPFTIFGGIVAFKLLQNERNAYVDGLRATARALAIAIDRNMADVANSLKVLATAELLRIGAFEGFYRYAGRVVLARPDLYRLVLVRTDGRIIFSTDTPYGTDFLQPMALSELNQAIATGQPVVGRDVADAGMPGQKTIMVFVPAPVDGEVRYVLVAFLNLSVISAIFAEQQLRPDWTGVVLDSKATILGRSRGADAYVGQPAPKLVADAVAGSADALIRYATQEGWPTLAGFARSTDTGWAVVLGMPADSVDPASTKTLAIVILTGISASLLALALAAVLGRQISRSVLGLLEPARAIADGLPISPPPPSRIVEIQRVMSKLVIASDTLAERERRRRQAEDHLARAQRVAAIGSWELSLTSRQIHWSAETFRIFGVRADDFAPTLSALEALVVEDDLPHVRAAVELALAGQAPGPNGLSLDYRIRRPDGAVRILRREGEPVFDTGGTLIALIGTVQDVTDVRAAETRRRELEQQLHQTQKMEALGQLTGGIAHDFNNLLAVILGNLEMAVDRQRKGQSAIKLDEASLRTAAQGTALTRQLLAFARRQPLRPVCHDLCQLVRDIAPMLERALNATVRLALDMPGAPCWVEIDSAQFEAALLNLVINARDAMPDGGTITIRLRADAAAAGAADFIAVAVEDIGIGMSGEIRARAFEPFFTTKGLGKGTGLGLSMVYGFVRQSGGHINLASAPGAGTRITMQFRRAPAPERSAEAHREAPIPPRRLRILLVEDEPDVRMTVAEMLREIGATVTATANARAALDILASGEEIDAVLTDIIMPDGMDGIALAERAAALRPGLRFAFMSGYAEFDERTLLIINQRPFLPKPFRKLELAAALESL
jgi:PAS domain S-box-containing protein